MPSGHPDGTSPVQVASGSALPDSAPPLAADDSTFDFTAQQFVTLYNGRTAKCDDKTVFYEKKCLDRIKSIHVVADQASCHRAPHDQRQSGRNLRVRCPALERSPRVWLRHRSAPLTTHCESNVGLGGWRIHQFVMGGCVISSAARHKPGRHPCTSSRFSARSC